MSGTHAGCGVARYFYGTDHGCECWNPMCTGFDHVCLCGQYWPGSVRTRFISFDPRGRAAGDPCLTRMRILCEDWRDDGLRWRVFELAQLDQRISRHGDLRFRTWAEAVAFAQDGIARDIAAQRDYLTKRAEAMAG